jgi:hypothetical protein
LRIELQRTLKRQKALLAAFPELKRQASSVLQQYGNAQEREFSRLQSRIGELKLELIGREKGSAAVKGRPELSDPEVAKRDTLVAQNPHMSAHDLCKRFDSANYPVPLPNDWSAEFNVKKWVEAYAIPKLRRRIQTLISKHKRRFK